MNTSSMIDDLKLRVSVATYNQVIFRHPEDGNMMLALERRAAVLPDGSVIVRSQPFGGGVHILNPTALQGLIGRLQFDSERSKQEQDFRILIPPSKWEVIKQYCLRHLKHEDDSELETEPDRELTEEFIETIKVKLRPPQYTVQPLGFTIENNPVRSSNEYARGQLTVHLYRTFRAEITDPLLGTIMWSISQLYRDQDLGALAQRNFEYSGGGHLNTILTLPLSRVKASFLALPPEDRFQNVVVDDHEVDESVLAILDDIDVPQYERM